MYGKSKDLSSGGSLYRLRTFNLERRTETRLQQYERELKRGTNRSVTLHRLAESAPQTSPVNASPSRSGECCNLHGEAKGESEENSEDRAPVALD